MNCICMFFIDNMTSNRFSSTCFMSFEKENSLSTYLLGCSISWAIMIFVAFLLVKKLMILATCYISGLVFYKKLDSELGFLKGNVSMRKECLVTRLESFMVEHLILT